MIDNPALVKFIIPLDPNDPPPHPCKISGNKEIFFPDILTEKRAAALIAAASPFPWKAIIGRTNPMRIDLIDANNEMTCHWHPTNPAGERTPNWENDAILIIHLIEIVRTQQNTIKELTDKINTLEKEKNDGTH